MSGREWRPGTVAMVTVGDESPVLGFRDGDGAATGWSLADYRLGSIWVECDRVTDVRPLVVIDPESREQRDELVRAISQRLVNQRVPFDILNGAITSALCSLVTDPKPEEPQGLGAVVEDCDGTRWVRSLRADVEFTSPWRDCSDDHFARHYDAIEAVRVLSPGVS